MASPFQANVLAITQALLPHLTKEEIAPFWESFSSFFEGLDTDSSKKLVMLVKLISVLSLFYFQKKITKLNPQKLERLMHRLSIFPIYKVTAGGHNE